MSRGHSRRVGPPALVRAAHLGPNHGQRVAAPRSAALGTAADAAAAAFAQLLAARVWRCPDSICHAARYATAPNPPLRPGEPRANEAHRGGLRTPHLPPRASLPRSLPRKVCHPRIEPATALLRCLLPLLLLSAHTATARVRRHELTAGGRDETRRDEVDETRRDERRREAEGTRREWRRERRRDESGDGSGDGRRETGDGRRDETR